MLCEFADGIGNGCGHPRRLADFGLVVMDMDSTLITIECIDEIADLQGIKPQVAAITASAMRGEIDYPESLRRRLALLAGLDEAALQRVYDERLRLSPGAERMLERLRSLGIKTLIVSSGFTFFTERLKERLSLDYTLSNTLEIENGKLTGRVLGRIVDAHAARAGATHPAESMGGVEGIPGEYLGNTWDRPRFLSMDEYQQKTVVCPRGFKKAGPQARVETASYCPDIVRALGAAIRLSRLRLHGVLSGLT